jgi:hypothetical protein
VKPKHIPDQYINHFTHPPILTTITHRPPAEMSITPSPSIAVTLVINPPAFRLGDAVELSVTAVTNSTYPITVYTWPYIFNPKQAQQRGGFEGWDRDTGLRLPLQEVEIMRKGESYTLGGPDDESFVTLEPGLPMKFNSSFLLASGGPRRYGTGPDPTKDGKSDVADGKAELLPGHRYLIDVRQDGFYDQELWWKKGRKEDVLDLKGMPTRNARVPSGKNIALRLEAPVEFEVLPLEQMDGWMDGCLFWETWARLG